jgi:hypothetical protein
MGTDSNPAGDRTAFLTYGKKTVERAVKTAAQAFILFLTPLVVSGQLDISTVDWGTGVNYALGGAILSLLTSVGSLPFGEPFSPSAVKE